MSRNRTNPNASQDRRKPRVSVEEKLRRSQVAEQLKNAGITISGWARSHGFQRHMVVGVLDGTFVGRYGEAHRICVALGLKSGSSCRPEDFKPSVQEAA